jgi:glycine betaine/proline transport system ATP-binding protein
MNSAEPKIKIESLVKIFGDNPRQALQRFRQGGTRDSILAETGNVLGVADVSVSIQEGELFVIMGLSGSGKSTLIRCLNRLINPTSGHVYIDDEDIVRASDRRLRELRRTKMSMVFQKFALFPHRTVVENVEYGLKIREVAAEKRRQKALDTLEIVGLHKWADRLPSDLSGGMQQRVGLARALATDPDILLMDEAFGALDPLIRREMQEELIRLQAELNKTVIFISHDIHEALKIGDRVAIMKDGAFVQVGTPQELVTAPADDYIKEFMFDVNRAQVLKAGAIARQTTPARLGRDSVRTALEQMQRQERERMYVVEENGKPAGFVTVRLLETALSQGEDDLSQTMKRQFPQVEASTTLDDLFHLYRQGLPIAVVDEGGKLQGILDQSDAIANIGRFSRESTEPTDSEQPQQVAV